MKTGNGYPASGKKSALPVWMQSAVLIRGDPNETTHQKKITGWKYLTRDEVEELLGFSMKSLMCIRWGDSGSEQLPRIL